MALFTVYTGPYIKKETRKLIKDKNSNTLPILLMAVIILAISEMFASIYLSGQFARLAIVGYYVVDLAAMYCLIFHLPRMAKGIYMMKKLRRT